MHVDVMSLFPSNEGPLQSDTCNRADDYRQTRRRTCLRPTVCCRRKQRDKSDTLSATPLGNLVGSGKRVT
jgi:hypothetical protein